MKLSWNTITVQQFQDVYRLSLNTKQDEMDKIERVICILFDKTEQEIDNVSMSEFADMARQVSFVMNNDIPGKPVKNFKVNGRKYAIVYDPTKLRHRQYVELLHYGADPVSNMHMVMASVVRPVKWFRLRKNRAQDHEKIAADMRDMPLIHVYHSCVFFCKLYVNLMRSIRASSVVEMMMTGMTEDEAMMLFEDSLSVMDGFIQQKSLQPSKV